MVWRDAASDRRALSFSGATMTMILCITGGIASGKSTLLSQCAQLGARIISADDIVHTLLSPGGKAVSKVAALFPATAENKAINRAKLGKEVFANAEKLRALEAIMHPLVRQAEKEWQVRQRRLGARFLVVEIPLLFETRTRFEFDAVITTHCASWLQRKRAMQRPNMTKAKLEAILGRQCKPVMRNHKADFLVMTGLGKAVSFRALKQIVGDVRCAKSC